MRIKYITMKDEKIYLKLLTLFKLIFSIILSIIGYFLLPISVFAIFIGICLFISFIMDLKK